MMLQQLRSLESRSTEADEQSGGGLPPGYRAQAIPWLVHLESGKEASLLSTSSGATGQDRGKKYPAPYLRRSGTDIKPQLLADKAEFVFGVADTKGKKTEAALAKATQRARARQADFLALVQACAEATSQEPVRQVAEFLQRGGVQPLLQDKEIAAADLVTFRVGTVYPFDLPAVRDFWAKAIPRLSERGVGKLESRTIMDWLRQLRETPAAEGGWECIVCGNPCTPERKHPVGITLPRSVADQQCALVSANKQAFYSYGLEQSLIAPTCRRCAEQYGRAINRLVADKHTHVSIGPLVYLFWVQGDSWSPASILSNPEPEEVRQLLAAAFGGDRAALHTDPTPFYATALSASGGRVVVRDWLETTVPRAKVALARYFALQELVDRDGGPGRPFGVYALAAATARDANKELRPETPCLLLHVALNAGPLPQWLLAQAVRRCRAEQSVTRPRAALIKMVLLSRQADLLLEESPMAQLDSRNRDPAYLCGRLLAVLERIQQAAIPGTKATLVDRFFGTASSAPASVFGRLLRGSQNHLTKLRKEKPRAHAALKRRVEEITYPDLRTFPKLLTLEQQGLFSLGYFHQCADDRAAARAHKQKQSGVPAPRPNAG
jgi:CRISPR-associated protein Csd1